MSSWLTNVHFWYGWWLYKPYCIDSVSMLTTKSKTTNVLLLFILLIHVVHRQICILNLRFQEIQYMVFAPGMLIFLTNICHVRMLLTISHKLVHLWWCYGHYKITLGTVIQVIRKLFNIYQNRQFFLIKLHKIHFV